MPPGAGCPGAGAEASGSLPPKLPTASWLAPYDLVAIQELRDEEVVDRTLPLLADRSDTFQAVISPPVGRGVTGRYAFLYRPGKVQVLGLERLYPDPDADEIESGTYWLYDGACGTGGC